MRTDIIAKYLLVPQLTSTKDGLPSCFWLLLSTKFLPLFTLLLVRKRSESARRLAYFDIAQRGSEGAHMVLDKRGVQRFVLVPTDDVRDDGVRERDEILLGLGIRFQDLVKIRIGRALKNVRSVSGPLSRETQRKGKEKKKKKIFRSGGRYVHAPFTATAGPKSSVALRRSDSSSRCFSSSALARGSSTASSS
jgi:hypothetical protein